MLRNAALVELVVCQVAWALAFLAPRKQSSSQKKVARAPESRWGIILGTIGFALVWVYIRPVDFEKSWPALAVSMILGPLSVALAWAATRHLGKQWRYEAALIEGHELIRTGPYGWVRHPIYTSMLGMVLATGLAWSWWPMFVAGLTFFLAGTEIRVRAEERLLAEHFGGAFTAYRARVPAFIPFIR